MGPADDPDVDGENRFSAMARVARPIIRIEAPAGRRTVIVVGNGRGGTSMVAGVLVALGLPMGAPGNALNYEDAEIVAAGRGTPPDAGSDAPSGDGLDPLRALIRERNARHDVWGWKDPSADLYLDRIKDVLVAPRAIFVHRDLASVAESMFVRSPDISIEQALLLALERTTRYWELLSRNGWPTLLLSYERARIAPDRLVAELTAFCGLAPTEGEVGRAVRFVSGTGGYRLLGR